MKINEQGLNIIKHFEGLRLKPYKCPAGLDTIGYGHVIRENEQYLYNGITKEQAEELLLKDLRHFEIGVLKLIKNEYLNENRFSALVSFAFNVGLGALRISTLRMKLNRGEIKEAGLELLKWCKIRGQIIKGLLLRRQAELNLYNKEDNNYN
jgi:lysozyme